MKSYQFVPTALLWIIASGIVFAQSENPGEIIRDVCLERTELITLHSEIVDQDYQLFISLPIYYELTKDSYPLIVELDAFTGFTITKGCIDAFTGLYPLMPHAILVAIGYGGTGSDALAKWISGRTRDFTPEPNGPTEEFYSKFILDRTSDSVEVKTGGAQHFLDFIVMELIPFMQTNYRVDENDRALLGASFGGLFALYALFREPASFNRYLIESPSIHYRNSIVLQYESDYANAHRDLPAEIFLCAGSLEGSLPEAIDNLEELLRSREYPNLVIEKVIFQDESHISCAPAAISRGLIEIYNNDQ